MKVAIVFCLAFVAMAAANLEEEVFDHIDIFWDKMPKLLPGLVTYFDLVDFFQKYDNDCDGCDADEWSVDEDEFAEGWAADIGLDLRDSVNRAYFKRMDVSRLYVQVFEEIDQNDALIMLDLVDLNLDGFLSELEFKLGFGFLASDLPWGTMFIDYRTNSTTDYFDHVSYNLSDSAATDGDWQRLFDDMDTNADGLLEPQEVNEFYVDGGYGTAETAQLFFDVIDLFGNGNCDRTFEWTAVFVQLDEDSNGELSFDEFTYMDYYIRPVGYNARAAMIEKARKFKVVQKLMA